MHRNNLWRFAALITLVFISAYVKSAPSIEDYGKLPDLDLMTLSPKGEKIAFRKTKDGSDILLILDRATLKPISSINLDDAKLLDIYFTDENYLIVRASRFSRITGYRGKHHRKFAYVLDIKKNKLKPLLEADEAVHDGQIDLSNVVGMTKDKKYVYMPAFVGNDRRLDPNYSLVRVKLSAPSTRKPLGIGDIHAIDFFVNKEGDPFIREKYSNDINKHVIEVKDKKKWRTLYEETTPIRTMIPVGLTPDFKHLVIAKENPQTQVAAYFLMSLETGEISTSRYENSEFDIASIISDINRIVYGVSFAGFNPSYQFYDKKLQERVDNILAMFPDSTVDISSWTEDFKNLIVKVSGSTAPGDFYLFEEGNKPLYLGSARGNIGSEDVHPIGKVNVKARDGLKIPTLITIPKASISNMKNLPAVVLPHGGPESYDRIEFDWLAQAMANQGYFVIQPQFRGSYGFGSTHRDAGDGEWGGKMIDDINDTVEFFRDKGMIDPDKVCIVGASYGGYAALTAPGYRPDLYKCAVSINGISSIPKMLQTEIYGYGHDHWVVSYFKGLTKKEGQSKSYLDEISPEHYAEKYQAAILLLHSENDRVVRLNQSKIMHSRLSDAKKNSTLVVLKGEDHFLSSGETRMEALSHVVEFLNKYLAN